MTRIGIIGTRGIPVGLIASLLSTSGIKIVSAEELKESPTPLDLGSRPYPDLNLDDREWSIAPETWEESTPNFEKSYKAFTDALKLIRTSHRGSRKFTVKRLPDKSGYHAEVTLTHDGVTLDAEGWAMSRRVAKVRAKRYLTYTLADHLYAISTYPE